MKKLMSGLFTCLLTACSDAELVVWTGGGRIYNKYLNNRNLMRTALHRKINKRTKIAERENNGLTTNS